MDNANWDKCVAFHGHQCPGLALGVRLCDYVRERLGLGFSPDEELVCIAETDACPLDAVQVLLGCTFGKGNLLYTPTGKSAYTFYSRATGQGVRVVALRKEQDMTREERTVFRRRNIGFVFQQYNLVPMLDVYENIVLPLRLDGEEADEACLEELSAALGIRELLGRMPGTLSGGQQQRVAIARALAVKPAILLADEPTGSLDSVTGMEVMGLLKTCAARFHQTVILVTHQEEAAQMADQILRMSDGKLVDGRQKEGRSEKEGRHAGV